MSAVTSTKAAPTLGFTLLLGLIMAIGPLSIDLYLPAFPGIARELQASDGQVQYTLSVYLLGLALGQAAYGPVADKYGRRLPLLAGLLLYVAAALLCAFAPSVGTLTLFRGLQALGGAAGAVITSSVVRDRYEGKAAASLFSTLMLVTGVAPAIAPSLGTWLLTLMPWRMLFVVLASFAALALLLSSLWLPETLPRAQRAGVRLRDTAGVYLSLLRNRPFLAYSLASGFTFGALFAYISGSPFLFLQHLHVSAGLYAVLFGVNSLGLTLAAQANRALLRRFEPARVASWAALAAGVVAALLLSSALLHLLSVPLLSVLFFSLLCCVGMLMPNNAALALSSVQTRVGSAAALTGTIQMTLGGLSGTLVGALGGSQVVIMAMILVCVVGVLSCYAAVRRFR
ncbi:multidrug effflux MFS transporter [Deinococcus sp. KNUC1210]|uniref:multidrug effflux MFS transporter n=1 Tax=Deinococcus sp. KNUC1210 TaxID=2917691 RepID=UPI001EF0D6BC|nr:multidrug effflux MFS transporter [Deinococcus sp. KNUC1210]ULH15741.1 multidrug effflux MFS transporter [Deinococcus sp. KNUC1210]